MDEDRDDIDTWLSEKVQPLLPPPGTFDRVRREARRRKRRRVALVAASAAAAAVVGGAVIPRVAGASFYVGRPASSATPGRPAQASPTPAAAGRMPGSMPRDFAPESVTFVGTGTGWILGRADAGHRCGPSTATVCLARTGNGGRTWRLVSPPPAGGPDGATGVGQIRFLNTRDGWAFGPQLWATHDGGRTWTRIRTGGMRVTALETRGTRVFAVWANCTGSGPAFAAQCHSFTLWSARASGGRWAQVAGVGSQQAPGGSGGAAQLVLTGTASYLLPPDGVLLSGTGPGAGTWQPVTGGPTPCLPGPPEADGQPSREMIASNGSGLVLLCTGPPGSGGQPGSLYYSSDGGHTWTREGHPPLAGTATSLSGTPAGGTIVIATTRGIEVSTDGGISWQLAGGSTAGGGFTYVGMTTSMQGVAVAADTGRHAVWFTYDGGTSWRPSRLR